MTISYPRKKTRQQAQDYRRFQQASFNGGQNSDTPATKIGPSDMALMRNVANYGDYFEGHYGIQVNSDERAPGVGEHYSMEQHPVTGRWLLHRGDKLWLSAGRRQAEWSEVASLGPDGSLEATGVLLREVALSGAVESYLSAMVLSGLAEGDTVYVRFEKDLGNYTVIVYENPDFTGPLASGVISDATSLPAEIALAEAGGSGVAGSVTAAADPVTVQDGEGVVGAAAVSVDFSLRGLTLENTDEWELWWEIVVSGGGTAATLTLYKDAGMTAIVASGSPLSDDDPFSISGATGIIGYANAIAFSSLSDGSYTGTPVQFTVPNISIDSASTISSFKDYGFTVFVRSAPPRNLFIDQQVSSYWLLSTPNGYGGFPLAGQETGAYEYRYLYGYARIADASGEPDYSANRITGRLQFEGPSNIAAADQTDYSLVTVDNPVSESFPIPLTLGSLTVAPGDASIPAGANAAAYITHISIYRTLDVGVNSPTTNPEQYIWVADVPIYSTTYTDSTPDEVLLARLEAGSRSEIPYIYALPSRGWREMDRGVGAIRVDFMFTAFPDAGSASYCDVQVIPRLIGYHNPQQRIVLQDPVSHLTSTRELMVVVCPSSAYALTTGINQDVGGGLYYIPIITNFERVSGNTGAASRYKLFRVDDSSFLAYCTDHTIRVFSAMSWGNPLDGSYVHKTLERALGDAKLGFIRGTVFFWFMDGDRKRCLRFGTGGNTGVRWTELERDGWIYPDLVSVQETDESLLKLTILGASDDTFYAIENEAPERIYEDESPTDAPVLRGAGAAQLSDLYIASWNGVTLYGRMVYNSFRLYGSQADAAADVNIMGMSDELLGPTDGVTFSGVVNGTVNVLSVADCSFTVINGVAVGELLPIPSPFRFRDLTATVEAFICAHMVSHVYMHFPYGMPAPTVKAKWYADGVLADSSSQVPEDGEIQSFRNVQGKRIALELETQSSGWQVTGYDTEYQTQDIRLRRGPWNSAEAVIQKEIATGMISWVNSLTSVMNRADRRVPKQNYQGLVPARDAGPFPGKYGQEFTEQDTFALVRDVESYTIMFWGKNLSGTPSAMLVDGEPAAYISFPSPDTIDVGSFQYALPQPADDGFWHHYAVTRDGDWFRVYQDGIEIGANFLSPGSVLALSGFTLGAGTLFDPRTYATCLSAAAVAYYVSHPEQLP